VRGFRNSHEERRGTGVVHYFNSNKPRMASQAKIFDCDSPFALLISVMDLTDAKSWQGQAYCARCVIGLPSNGFRPQKDSTNYVPVKLSTSCIKNGNAIREATINEIETAR
jgi:hypothetical protein